MFNRQFTKIEKAMIIILIIIVLAAAYYFLVLSPLQTSLQNAESEIANLQSQVDINTTKAAKYDQMKAAVDAVLADPDTVETPEYDNITNVMTFLNGILGDSKDYTLSFSTSESNTDSSETVVVRRVATMTFSKDNYLEARAAIDDLQGSPYNCKLGSLTIVADLSSDSTGEETDDTAETTEGSATPTATTNNDTSKTADEAEDAEVEESSIDNSAVGVNVTMTFYEKKTVEPDPLATLAAAVAAEEAEE